MTYGISSLGHELTGQVVVLDMVSSFVCIGRLAEHQGDFLRLDDADVHDLRDTTSTRDQYVLKCRLHGHMPNRQQAWLSLREVVGISRLADVIVD